MKFALNRFLARPLRVGLAIGACLTCALVAQQQKPVTTELPAPNSDALRHKAWYQYGGDPDQSKYVDLKQITKSNVNQLQVAWNYPASNGTASMFNPIVIDGVMYLLGSDNSLTALDAATGREIWIHANLNGIIKRGINYWESKDRKDRRLIFCMNNTLQAIDATTGKSILSFGDHGSTNLREGLARDPASIGRIQSTTPGQIFENLIFLGSSPGENLFSAPGHVRAYDVVTGKLAWVFHTIPLPGEFGYDTWPKDAYKYIGGVNTWGEITVDTKNGIVFFPLGAPTYDYYGADRTGTGLFGDCILALDARTGKRLWHFQCVHHDLWDYDACIAAQLITIKHDGKMVEAVAMPSKQGFLYVLNRLTGEPIWPIEERAVPPSTMPEEHSWPTQPFPMVPPPFARQIVTPDDVNPYFTPEQQARWKKRIAAAKTGLFQPLSDQYETISMPGTTGGANFGDSAADPDHGIVFVASQEYPSVLRLNIEVKGGGVPLTADRMTRAKEAYVTYCQACHGAERAGVASFPPLLNIGDHVTIDAFKTIIGVGKGQMPGFPHIDEGILNDLYAYLGGNSGARGGRGARRGGNGGGGAGLGARRGGAAIDDAANGAEGSRRGPVVASGGAPTSAPAGGRGFGAPNGMREYPAGVTRPKNNYTTGYGLEFPNLLSPPWSTITCYDLNTGTIKWHRALGEDPTLLARGIHDTGVPNGSQRKGMIVTSTGLLFATCKDAKLYAYDTDDGKMLWSTQLPRNPEGLPAMYEAGGRQFLIVCSMAEVVAGLNRSPLQPGYIVYALPQSK
ncbi:MAG TPA: PQQ-binding-like beta-propeller repeat protein [Tepidisphaeraceae bacterium]|jgi:quinoprotein glucose dehydrogenase